MAKNGDFARANRNVSSRGQLESNSKFIKNSKDDLTISIPKGKITAHKVGFLAATAGSIVLLPTCAYTGLSAIACAVQPSKFGITDIIVYGVIALLSGKFGFKLVKGAKYCYGKMNGKDETKDETSETHIQKKK